MMLDIELELAVCKVPTHFTISLGSFFGLGIQTVTFLGFPANYCPDSQKLYLSEVLPSM